MEHTIAPVYDANSRILILGSFPSVRSRETGFFYGHGKNRFWKVVAAVFESDEPKTVDEKKAFLLKNKIALWDVIARCDITGSADSSIKNVVPNDISAILERSNVTQIYVNGKTAKKYYDKYIRCAVNRDAIVLPSTSPANAMWSAEALINEWKRIRTGE